MPRTIITIFLIVLSYSALSQNRTARFLERSYKKESQEMLADFFQNWEGKATPITQYEFDNLNDTLKNAHLIFQKFYTPQNLSGIGGCEFGEIYKGTNYVIVQNHLQVYQTDQVYFTQQEIDSIALSNIYHVYEVSQNDTANINLWKRRYFKNRKSMKQWAYEFDHQTKDSLLAKIEDFRPNVLIDSNVVYLTSEYRNVLLNFLGEINYDEYSESDKKEKFLENQILISQGVFSFWHLITYPSIQRITFDKNFEYVEIKFRILHEGGEAILKNIDGEWTLLSSNRTWIE